MSDVLLALLVTVPLAVAVLPLLFGLRFKRAGWPIALAGTLATTVMASLLAVDIYRASLAPTTEGQRLVHELAGYPAPYGIELVGDGLSALVALLIGVVAVAVLVYDRSTRRPNAFYSGYLLLTGGLFGMALTGDLFNLFVFLEIVGLVTYALVATGDGGESAYGALKYLFVGTVGASFYLLGVGYVLVSTGTLNMLDAQSALADVGYGDPLVQAAFGFILVGFMLKIAIFPLHTWQPDAYTHAPDTVTAFISALVSTTAAYALIRIAFDVFTVDFFAANPLIAEGVVLLASISIVVGSLLAAMQTEIKRVFAYSSVAQFGMIVVAIGLNSRTALLGAVIHLIGHGIMKATLFMGAGLFSDAYGASTISDYAGLAKRAPYTGGAMAVTGLALVGIPPSIGILGKLYIGLGAIEEGSWAVAVVIFVSTLLTLTYVARLIEAMYFKSATAVEADETATSESADQVPITESTLADGGRDTRIPRDRLAVVVLLAVSTVVLFASFGLFDAMLEPVFGRFFQ